MRTNETASQASQRALTRTSKLHERNLLRMRDPTHRMGTHRMGTRERIKKGRGFPSVKIGTMRKILAWPLRKDDTHKSRSVSSFQDLAYAGEALSGGVARPGGQLAEAARVMVVVVVVVVVVIVVVVVEAVVYLFDNSDSSRNSNDSTNSNDHANDDNSNSRPRRPA